MARTWRRFLQLDEPAISTAPRPWEATKRRWRRVHAAKTAGAVAAASSLTLVDSIFEMTDTGPWAVITVVILMQQTLGATTQKAVNRCAGTVLAAAAAMLTGLCCHSLPESLAVPFLVCCVLLGTYALTLLGSTPGWAKWQYAITMSCLTYVFLALLAYRERVLASAYRILMVVAGALIACVASLAPPRLRAWKQLRADARRELHEDGVGDRLCY